MKMKQIVTFASVPATLPKHIVPQFPTTPKNTVTKFYEVAINILNST